MAAGIGEASAIATFLQVGLSIATTLNTYISDVRDAPTEVCDLANEITSTLWQVDVLNDLIASNDPSNGWSAKGVVFAQKSLAESEKIIKKILTLLQKAGSSSNTTKVVTLDSIDISLFSQLRWPTFKPQLEKVKRRLECIRMDICLLCGMHKAISGSTKQERDTASEAVVKFAQSRATAKAVLRKVTAMHKGNVGEPQSPPPFRVRFDEPAKRASRRRTPRPGGYRIDMGEDTEPMTLSGKDPEDVHIQFTSLTAAIREMITDEHQAEEAARKKAAEEKHAHEQEVLEEYKRGLVEKYTDLERKAAALREQLKRGFEPELPDEQIDSHIKRLQAKELSNDEILKRIADFGFRQTGSVEVESDQATLVSTSNRPENGRLWSQLRKGLKDGDRNPIPMALRQNHSIPGLAKVTSISLSFDGEEWHVVQVNISMPWLINRLAAEEKRDSRSIGKINETLKAYSKLPRECRFAAEAWLLAAGNRKYAWALLYAHTTKTSVSKPRKMLQKAVFGSAIEAQVDNVILVYRATRDSQGHSYDDRKGDEDVEGEADRAKVPADDSATLIPPTEKPPDSPATQASAPRVTAPPNRGPEGPNPFDQAYQNFQPPPPPPQAGPYPQLYPYPSPMGRPPPPYAGMPPPPSSAPSPFSPYPPYTGGLAYDPYASSYHPQYPTYDPFRPNAAYAYNPYYTPASPPPPAAAPTPRSPRHSPPTSKSRPNSYSYSAPPPPPAPYRGRDRSLETVDRRHTIYRPPSAYSRPTDTYSASRANRSVVIHDPRSQPAYSSDERRKGSVAPPRRASSRRYAYDDYPRRRNSRRRSPSPSYYSSDDSLERKSTQMDDYMYNFDVPATSKSNSRVHRPKSGRSFATSDSGYSSHRPREEGTHQPPNWVLYRPTSAANRSSSPEFSDDSSNLSVDAKTLKENDLRDHLLSKYTTSEVGSSRAATDGPRIEEVLSENGDIGRGKEKEKDVEVVEDEEDPWSGWGAGKKNKKKKKATVNGVNEGNNGEAPPPPVEDYEDDWAAFTSVGKKKKGKKVKVNGTHDEIAPPPPPPESDAVDSNIHTERNGDGDGDDKTNGTDGPEPGDT